MNAVTRTRPGHWSDKPNGPDAQFMDLVEGDKRVSLAEQQDHLPDVGAPLPVWLAVAFVAIFPLLVALVVNLVRLHFLP